MTTFITKSGVMVVLCVGALIASIAGINGCSTKSQPVTLNILAASSLSNALDDINELFHQSAAEIKITAIYAASGDLATQIENGAPADLFISASTKQMDWLESMGLLLPGTRINLVGNKIVLAVPLSSTLKIEGFEDLPGSGVQKIAMGDPGFVPVGTYGLEAIEMLGIDYESLVPKIILAGSARHVLSYLENEIVDAGILFATDIAFSEKVRAVATAPDEVNKNIFYPAALLKAGKNQEAAKQYLDFLSGNEARTIFEKYGFLVIADSQDTGWQQQGD